MLELYQKYYIDRGQEQIDLFQQLANRFGIGRALYPGSFVHVTPSFSIPYVCYIDGDHHAQEFFGEAEHVNDLVNARKTYPEKARIEFFSPEAALAYKHQGQTVPAFDLLISQHATPASDPCKEFLRTGGLLLASNIHGGAIRTAHDDDFQLIGVFNRQGGRYTFSDQNLKEYLTKKIATLYLFEKRGHAQSQSLS